MNLPTEMRRATMTWSTLRCASAAGLRKSRWASKARMAESVAGSRQIGQQKENPATPDAPPITLDASGRLVFPGRG
jgi:hypothetical protein